MFRKIMLLVLSVGAWSVYAAPNLLLNGDFSEGMKYWVIHNKNGISIDPKVAPGGKNALKMVSAKGHYGANYTVSGQKLKPDTDYTLRGLIKMDGNAKACFVFCRSPRAGKNRSSRVLDRTSGWTEVYVLLNSGKAKAMPVVLSVTGAGTVWFADASVEEGNHLPTENLFVNSDFKKQTRYLEVPDNWTPDLQTPIAEAENYIYRISKEPPPVSGAGVLEVERAQIVSQLIQRPVPGLDYTFSFYAKNAISGDPAVLEIRCGSKQFIRLTDQWKRYSFTTDFKTKLSSLSVRASNYKRFFYSAPQLVLGKTAQEWKAPVKKAAPEVVTNIKEAVAEAVSRKITGEPTESDWASAPVYPIHHITKAKGLTDNRMAAVDSYAAILHNDQYIFVRFKGKKDSAIKTGNRLKLDWADFSDTFELFISDSALDGTYIHYAADVNGNTYSGRNTSAEILGITSKVSAGGDSWTADMKVPLSLFRSNKNWKIAFCRCYNHARYGRMALDWSQPGSRHNTTKFGILKGISVKPVASLELVRLYGSEDNRKLCYEFSGLKPEMSGSTLESAIYLNGRELWKKTQVLKSARGEIVLPEDYEKMTETGTRIALKVIGKNNKIYYQASRVLYLMFSSYARHNEGMFVYPKYNLYTERDRTVDLIVNLDMKKYDRLRVTVLDEKGKGVYRQETKGDMAIPCAKFVNGTYKVKVEALKDGKVVDVRSYESFRKLPFRPEMVRLNRLTRCLTDAKGSQIYMMYDPGTSSAGAFDPDTVRDMDRLFASTVKSGFNGMRTIFTGKPEKVLLRMKLAEKYKLPILADFVMRYPKSFFAKGPDHAAGKENEKTMLEYTGELQKICFGKYGVLTYVPYHEPGYYRQGRGIVDMYRVPALLPELRKGDPYRPISGFWAPPHWDANGEPFGSIDGVDYFIVDIYTRNLKMFNDELFRISHASRVVRIPIGLIMNVENLGTDVRECPTPAEFRTEVYSALIAGYRLIYLYVGIPPVRETWRELLRVNRDLPKIAEYLRDDNCRELIAANEENVSYAVYRRGRELLVIAAGKNNDRKSRLSIDLNAVCGVKSADGKAMFSAEKAAVKNGRFEYILPPSGSGVWIFQLPH